MRGVAIPIILLSLVATSALARQRGRPLFRWEVAEHVPRAPGARVPPGFVERRVAADPRGAWAEMEALVESQRPTGGGEIPPSRAKAVFAASDRRQWDGKLDDPTSRVLTHVRPLAGQRPWVLDVRQVST